MKLIMAAMIELRCLINCASLCSSRFQPFVADWPIWLRGGQHLFRARLTQAMNLHASGARLGRIASPHYAQSMHITPL